jgi:hypothetical protein
MSRAIILSHTARAVPGYVDPCRTINI